MSDKLLTPIEIGLTAAIVAIEGNEPAILIAPGSGPDDLAGLPFGPFDAVAHRTFEIGLRAWVQEQAGLRLGYVEQLYTFGDRGRHTGPGDTDIHMFDAKDWYEGKNAHKEAAKDAKQEKKEAKKEERAKKKAEKKSSG